MKNLIIVLTFLTTSVHAFVPRFPLITALMACKGDDEVKALEKKLRQANSSITVLQEQVLENAERADELNQDLIEKNEELSELEGSLFECESDLSELEDERTELESSILDMETNIASVYLVSWELNTECNADVLTFLPSLGTVTSDTRELIFSLFEDHELYMIVPGEDIVEWTADRFTYKGNFLYLDASDSTLNLETRVEYGAYDSELGMGFLAYLTEDGLRRLEMAKLEGHALARRAQVVWTLYGSSREIETCLRLNYDNIETFIEE